MSLEELFRQAECLEGGRKNGTSNTIGLNQIGAFFDKVATDQDYSIEGRLFLAQSGIDSAKIEHLIEAIIADENKITKENSSGIIQNKFEHIHYPRLASQQVEYIRLQKMTNMWHDFLDEALEEITNTRKSRIVVDTSIKYFPSDPNTVQMYQTRAKVYATHMSNFKNPCQIISDSLVSLKEISLLEEPNTKSQIGFFNALDAILDKNFFTNVDDIGYQATLPDGIKAMANGSISFMQKQYREENLKNVTTYDAIDLFVQDKYPDGMAPWTHIWVALRAGLYDLVEEIVEKFARNKVKSDLRDFMAALKTFVIEKSEIPTPDDRSKFAIDTAGLRDDPFRQHCLAFAVGQEIPSQTSVILSAEDFVFSLIQPLRFTSPKSGIDASLRRSIQETIYNEAKIVFPDSGFVLPFLLLLSLNFSACGDELSKCTIYPCEIVHACIALKAANLWDSPAIQNMIGQFVTFLPNQLCGRAVDYLSFAADHKLLADYLLHLEPSIASLTLEGRPVAAQLLQQDIAQSVISVRSLKLASIVDDVEGSFQIVEGLVDGDMLSNVELCEAVSITTNLCKKLHDRGDDLRASRAQRCAFAFAFSALAQLNNIGLSMLDKLIIDCEELNKTVYDDTQLETMIVNSIRCLCHVARVFSHLQRGDSKGALRLAASAPHVIPTKPEQVNGALRFVSPENIFNKIDFSQEYMGTDFGYTVRSVFGSDGDISVVGAKAWSACVRMIADVSIRLSNEAKRFDDNESYSALQNFISLLKIDE